jgi:hypothetical protein
LLLLRDLREVFFSYEIVYVPFVNIYSLAKMMGTAERLIIEMRDKLPTLDDSSLSSSSEQGSTMSSPRSNAKQEAISALCALGYKPQDASKMVQGITQEDKSCEDIIRLRYHCHGCNDEIHLRSVLIIWLMLTLALRH